MNLLAALWAGALGVPVGAFLNVVVDILYAYLNPRIRYT